MTDLTILQFAPAGKAGKLPLVEDVLQAVRAGLLEQPLPRPGGIPAAVEQDDCIIFVLLDTQHLKRELLIHTPR